MKRAICLYLVTLAIPVLALSPVRWPSDPFALSSICDRIIVIDVSNIEWQAPKKEKGMEVSEFVVKGNLIETIRGQKGNDMFTHKGSTSKILDESEFVSSFGDNSQRSWLPQLPGNVTMMDAIVSSISAM